MGRVGRRLTSLAAVIRIEQKKLEELQARIEHFVVAQAIDTHTVPTVPGTVATAQATETSTAPMDNTYVEPLRMAEAPGTVGEEHQEYQETASGTAEQAAETQNEQHACSSVREIVQTESAQPYPDAAADLDVIGLVDALRPTVETLIELRGGDAAIELHFDHTGLTVRHFNPQLSALVALQLPPASFPNYRCEQPVSVGFRLTEFMDLLTTSGPGGAVSLRCALGPRRLHPAGLGAPDAASSTDQGVKGDTGEIADMTSMTGDTGDTGNGTFPGTVIIQYIRGSARQEFPCVPRGAAPLAPAPPTELPYDITTVLPAAWLFNAVHMDMASTGDTIQIQATEEGILFMVPNTDSRHLLPCPCGPAIGSTMVYGQEPTTATFNLHILKAYLGTVGPGPKTWQPTVELKFGHALPLEITHRLGSTDAYGHMQFFLAPTMPLAQI